MEAVLLIYFSPQVPYPHSIHYAHTCEKVFQILRLPVGLVIQSFR